MEKTRTNSVLSTIHELKDTLTPAARRIGDFVLNNASRVVNMTMTELASESGVASESSVVRFYRSLGYEGYHDFKVTLASEIAGSSIYHSYEDITIDDAPMTVARKIFAGSINTLQENLRNLNPAILEEATLILEESRRIVVLGYGVSSSIANNAAFKLSLLEKDVFYSTDSHLNAIVLSKLKIGDSVLAISHSGESKDLVTPLEKLKGPIKIIAITGFKESSLAHIADLSITTFSEERNMRTDAMVSRCVQMVITDVLFTTLAVRQGREGLQKLSEGRRALSYLKF